MLSRNTLLVLCLGALLLAVGFSEYIDNTATDLPVVADTIVESGNHTDRQREQLRQDLETYLDEQPREYEVQLAEALQLFAEKKYEDADELFETLRSQFPNQPDLLAPHAQTLALINDGSFDGKPFELLSLSLDIDSGHKPSLWMMALVNQNMGNHEAAVILFKMLKRELSAEVKSIETIDAAMAMSMLQTDGQLDVEETADMEADSETVNEVNNDTGGEIQSASVAPAINLFITLAAEITNTFSPDDIVYIYAQDADDSSMPLAVTRRKVSDFPTTVTLDDSMAMMPALRLSTSEMVTVGARASRSGTAMPMAGDWEVELYKVPVGTTETIPLSIEYELK
ncbi:MAG: tetratricopeptide repeat protein [Granulosicoccus sp.]